MPAAVIPIGELKRDLRHAPHWGNWSLLEVAPPGCQPVPLGILLVDRETDELTRRFRTTGEMLRLLELEEQEIDILDFLPADLSEKAREQGGLALIDSLEESLSDFLRISGRTAISFVGNPQAAVDRLFDEFVDSEIRPYETHLPLYGLRAAATKFGEGMAPGEEAWIRVPGHVRITADMFVGRVVGKSMEPLIADDSLCIFRAGVTGTRQGKNLLIEKFSESDFASRYTVKRYTSRKKPVRSAFGSTEDDEAWEHATIRLEPLNPDFEAFELGPDEFRVIAEFVAVLE